jgi:pimeloyl-ACP methyl ester carboxylesterase
MKNNKKIKYAIYGFLSFVIVIMTSITYADIPVENLKKEYANEHSKFIDINEIQVHYRDEGKGFPIVLIHGTASSLHTWDAWTNQLKKTNRVIRLDLPGFGITGPKKDADYSIGAYTRFLHSFLQKLQLTKFHISGSSLGGNIAWNYAAEYPAKVEKLILVASSGLPTYKPQPAIFKMAKIPLLRSLFLYVTPRILISKNLKEVYADDAKISSELVTRYHKMALRVGNRQAFIDRAKIDFRGDAKKYRDKLKSIQAPTLLIWGIQDLWIPIDNGKRMNVLIPDSKFVTLSNSGHVPMEENPKESFKILESFLEPSVFQ